MRRLINRTDEIPKIETILNSYVESDLQVPQGDQFLDGAWRPSVSPYAKHNNSTVYRPMTVSMGVSRPEAAVPRNVPRDPKFSDPARLARAGGTSWAHRSRKLWR